MELWFVFYFAAGIAAGPAATAGFAATGTAATFGNAGVSSAKVAFSSASCAAVSIAIAWSLENLCARISSAFISPPKLLLEFCVERQKAPPDVTQTEPATTE